MGSRAVWCLACAACVAPARHQGVGMVRTVGGRSSDLELAPHEVSDEADLPQLALARDQGRAVDAALRWVLDRATGVEAAVGEYAVAAVFVAPKAWWELGPDGLELHPASGDGHLSVYVRDAADGRVVHGLTVHATVTAPDGTVLADQDLPYGWDVPLDEYGDDLLLRGAGRYGVRLAIAPARFERHDPVNGDRFAELRRAELTVDLVPADLAALPVAAAAPLAQAQGAAVGRALARMAGDEATHGGALAARDVLVAYAAELAEPTWRMHGDHLRWDTTVDQSTAANAHLEIVPRDQESGRFLPGLAVEVTVSDARGRGHGTEILPLMWHPWLEHYGRNWRVPRTRDDYVLHVRVAPPPWRRYDGPRFSAPIDATFAPVRIVTGVR